MRKAARYRRDVTSIFFIYTLDLVIPHLLILHLNLRAWHHNKNRLAVIPSFAAMDEHAVRRMDCF